MTEADARRLAEIRQAGAMRDAGYHAPPRNDDLVFLLRLLDEAEARNAYQRKASDAAAQNLRDVWSALRMVQDAVEELGPVGAARSRYVGPPNPIGDAEAIIIGIQKIIGQHDRRERELLAANNAEVERRRAAEDRLRWRPIETAPKDGSKVLLLGFEGELEVGYWFPEGDSWADENGNACAAGSGTIQVTGWFAGGGWFQPNEVKMWLPLPEPPHD